MTYFVANIIGAIPWIFFFFKRKDLRKEMLLMSLLATHLALFDLLYVPSYWIPKTFLNIPVGIEGFIFSFEIGGIAAALFEYLVDISPIKIRSYHNPLSIAVLLVVLPIAFLTNILFPINVTVGIHAGLFVGIIILLLLRPDLLKSVIIASFSFASIYFASLLIWTSIFPETIRWFTFQNLPRLFIFNVPLYEITFAFLFGAYWGNLYELLFGYKFKKYKQKNK